MLVLVLHGHMLQLPGLQMLGPGPQVLHVEPPHLLQSMRTVRTSNLPRFRPSHLEILPRLIQISRAVPPIASGSRGRRKCWHAGELKIEG